MVGNECDFHVLPSWRLRVGVAESLQRVKRALISDIHSNLESLEAVLADIRAQGITPSIASATSSAMVPTRAKCIDLVMKCDVCLLGNHDQGALFDPEGFNSGAERAIFGRASNWRTARHGRQRQRRLGFPRRAAAKPTEDNMLFVHGSARNPLNEYVFPEDIYNKRKLEKIFALIPQYSFQGHTHVPGVFTKSYNFFSPEELNYEYRLGKRRR